MIKILAVLYRKPELSTAEFEEYYMNVHVPLVVSHYGSLYKNSVRNCLKDVSRLTTYAGRDGKSEDEPLPDAITEIILEGEGELEEFTRIASTPEIRAELLRDEDNFLDRGKSFLSFVSSISEGLDSNKRAIHTVTSRP